MQLGECAVALPWQTLACNSMIPRQTNPQPEKPWYLSQPNAPPPASSESLPRRRENTKNKDVTPIPLYLCLYLMCQTKQFSPRRKTCTSTGSNDYFGYPTRKTQTWISTRTSIKSLLTARSACSMCPRVPTQGNLSDSLDRSCSINSLRPQVHPAPWCRGNRRAHTRMPERCHGMLR